MKHRFYFSLLALVLILFAIIPYTYVPKDVYAYNESDKLYVSAEILYLREGPGLSYPIITTLQEGQELSFIEKQEDWLHVYAGNSEGWVASWLTSSKETENETGSSTNQIAISQVDHLNVRQEPSLSSPILSQLYVGEEAVVLNIQNDWAQILFNGIQGWVSTEYLSINEMKQQEPEQPVEEQTKESIDENLNKIENDPNTFTVVVDAANLRKKPDLTSKKVGVVEKNQQYKVLERDHNWVKIQINDKDEGWIYSFYGTFRTNIDSPTNEEETSTEANADESITIIYNGTNLREEASTSSNVVVHANAGETFKIIDRQGDWYKVQVNDATTAFVANWVVSSSENTEINNETNEERKKGTLKGVTIVVDPGHGGNDKGTTGARGTEEKEINLNTVELLKSKLRSAGANVILTRESDTYVDLRKRVSIAHQYAADAFISIHYDATEDSSISGFTTYYMNSYQQELAEYVHAGLSNKVTLRDRGVQPGNYLVLRENKQNAILIELGYLSNPNEERIVTTDYYREQATLGIYEGLLKYFDAQL